MMCEGAALRENLGVRRPANRFNVGREQLRA
jgi:hypothetical protein